MKKAVSGLILEGKAREMLADGTGILKIAKILGVRSASTVTAMWPSFIFRHNTRERLGINEMGGAEIALSN